jgi:hypothetical protein
MASDMFMASIEAWFTSASQKLRVQAGHSPDPAEPVKRIVSARAARVLKETTTIKSEHPQSEPKLDFAISSVVRRFNDFKRDQEKKAHAKKFKGI